jgi:hypothetical protein
MLRRTASLALLLGLTLVSAAPASGPVAGSALSDDSYASTRRVKAEVLAVGPAPSYALHLREESGKEIQVALDESVKLRSASKKMFEGRKKLVPEDLVLAQRVQLTYRPEPFRLLEVKVLELKVVAEPSGG